MDLSGFTGYVGVDIGGQSVRVGTLRDGELVVRDSRPPRNCAPAAEQIVALARELAGGTPRPGHRLARPARLAHRPHALRRTSRGRMSITRAWATPSAARYVDNDANVAGLAEATLGAGRGHQIVSGFTLGTGIGFFTIMGGHIYHGRLDVEGGHQLIDERAPVRLRRAAAWRRSRPPRRLRRAPAKARESTTRSSGRDRPLPGLGDHQHQRAGVPGRSRPGRRHDQRGRCSSRRCWSACSSSTACCRPHGEGGGVGPPGRHLRGDRPGAPGPRHVRSSARPQRLAECPAR